MKGKVLIVDDEESIRKVIRRILESDGFHVQESSDAFTAMAAIDSNPPDAVVLDIKMPGMDGLAFLEHIRKTGSQVPVVILTGHGDQFTAKECLDAGAVAYLEKPPDRHELILRVRAAAAQGRLARGAHVPSEPPQLLGKTEAIKKLKEQMAKAAASSATVLICGESGTGKELVARRLHYMSSRAMGPFIRVNCAAIPEELVESELFGHEKGSFTGAYKKQLGKFVQADGGSIFLDEVGDMSLKAQAKVLRVLQDGEVEPVGAGKPFTVDVRVIAATNKDLLQEMRQGRFREDLYYRLAVVVLKVPPLRERKEDIPLLVEHFTQLFCKEYNRRPKKWSKRAMETMMAYHWPGNVRELKNVVERAVIMEVSDTIESVELGTWHRGAEHPLSKLLEAPSLSDFQREAEKEYIRHQLEKHGWNIAATARAIKTPRSNLYKKIQAYGLRRNDE